MTLKVYIGNTPVEKIFLGVSQLPKVSLGNYEFTAGSKLSADFTTGTYKASGAAKTFADLFTFTRAGKAWLVKDTGLQEYAADVPRFDNGLLIERESTCLNGNSFLLDAFSARKRGTIATSDGVTRLSEYTDTSYYYPQPAAFTDVAVCFTLFTKAGGQVTMIANNSSPTVKKVGNTYVFVSEQGYTSELSGALWDAQMTTNPATVIAFQIEEGSVKTTPIKTTTTPVTRPADFLLNNIIGTTVTGDWDSTLTLSIVAGKLAHSGYGCIRSLEIN